MKANQHSVKMVFSFLFIFQKKKSIAYGAELVSNRIVLEAENLTVRCSVVKKGNIKIMN